MKTLLFTLSLIGAAALACANPAAGCGPMGNAPMGYAQGNMTMGCDMGKACGGSMGVPLLETVTYALKELNLKDNPDIRLALKLYKKDMRSLKPHIPTEAFANSTFNPEIYAQNATPAKALKAQSDLFETIYMVLNDEQKVQFPQLMGIYQHHMSFANVQKMCNMRSGMGNMNAPMCDTHQPLNCGAKNCPMPMQKMPMKKMPTTKKP